MQISISLITSVSQNLTLPVFDKLFHPKYVEKFATKPHEHIKLAIEKSLHLKLNSHTLAPIFFDTPSWKMYLPKIRLDISRCLIETPNSIYLQNIQNILSEYPNHTRCYTDGSKSKNRSACAFSVESNIYSYRLRNSFSVFSAELTAILLCLQSILQIKDKSKYIILSDSLGSLQILMDHQSPNPIVQRILLILHTLFLNKKQITFIWIPAHIGENLSDTVDLAAKQATRLRKITRKLLPISKDINKYYQKYISNAWFEQWKETPYSNKLRQIKSSPEPWKSSTQKSRREEILITRLRIGHTKLTHTHLISHLFPPDCPKCHCENVTVDHLFTCPSLTHIRTIHGLPHNRPQALKNSIEYISISHPSYPI